ncbi:MAG: hypothetical protein CMJ58_28475 [Planctomycetaceae bacterium]|nr:hypothetical protein [Planctomycetaceae bacterium]
MRGHAKSSFDQVRFRLSPGLFLKKQKLYRLEMALVEGPGVEPIEFAAVKWSKTDRLDLFDSFKEQLSLTELDQLVLGWGRGKEAPGDIADVGRLAGLNNSGDEYSGLFEEICV